MIYQTQKLLNLQNQAVKVKIRRSRLKFWVGLSGAMVVVIAATVPTLAVSPPVSSMPVLSQAAPQTTPNAIDALPSSGRTGYPQRLAPIINDYAGLLTPDDAAKIRSLFEQLQAGQGIEAVVVTVESISAYDQPNQTIEGFATGLFNTWGIGDANRNNGVLIVLSVSDRAVRIELGSGYSRAYDAKMQTIIDEYMVPQFRQGNYSRGLYQGSQALADDLTAPPPAPRPDISQPTSAPQVTVTEKNHPLMDWLAVFLGSVGAGIVGLGLTIYSRFRKRKCPNCRVQMTRLQGDAALSYLDSGQAVEKQIGSVFYDICQCPQCGQHTIKRITVPFAPFESCPSCHYRTLKTNQHTTVKPTYHSTGQALLTRQCQHCSYNDRRTITLSRLEKSSIASYGSGSSSGGSSSGGSSSGGSSSGGGASGNW